MTLYESPLHRILCQFWLKLAIWFLSKKFLKAVNVFSLCGYYLPLKKCMPLNLNKFEFPLPKNTLCHVWLKLAQRFWRSCQYISICCHYLPLEKGQEPSFERNLIPFTQECFVQSLVEIRLVVLENKSSTYQCIFTI